MWRSSELQTLGTIALKYGTEDFGSPASPAGAAVAGVGIGTGACCCPAAGWAAAKVGTRPLSGLKSAPQREHHGGKRPRSSEEIAFEQLAQKSVAIGLAPGRKAVRA